MSLQGIIFIDILSVGFLLLVLNLVRTKRLHISYAVVWVLAIILLMTIISIPSVLTYLPLVIGARYPASAISLLAFVLIFLTLIFFSVQLSTIASRQIELAQAIAIQDLMKREESAEEDSIE